MRADTQKAALLTLLGLEWVTPQRALSAIGCMSLAQRVSEWRRDGYEFHQRVVVAGRSRFAAYKLARKPKV